MRGWCVGVALCGALLFGGSPTATQAPSEFAARVAQLSDVGGFFDTDNLISNESDYLSVLPALRDARVTGGAYIGVGPDQNFSYIAHIRPEVAFIVDIRRDNFLLHLLFKALFATAETRIEYVSLLFGRAVPADLDSWRSASVARLLEHAERGAKAPGGSDPSIERAIRSFGVPLRDGDIDTIRRFQQTFGANGPGLKFNTFGRPPREIYPTYGELLAARASTGDGSYLATEERFNVVRSLQQRDLVIPVVGDIAGSVAVPAVARLMKARGDRLSAFYVSNVESYLFQDDRFRRWMDNLALIPRTSRSVIIRSVFAGAGSASHLDAVDSLLTEFSAGRVRGYCNLTSPR